VFNSSIQDDERPQNYLLVIALCKITSDVRTTCLLHVYARWGQTSELLVWYFYVRWRHTSELHIIATKYFFFIPLFIWCPILELLTCCSTLHDVVRIQDYSFAISLSATSSPLSFHLTRWRHTCVVALTLSYESPTVSDIRSLCLWSSSLELRTEKKEASILRKFETSTNLCSNCSLRHICKLHLI